MEDVKVPRMGKNGLCEGAEKISNSTGNTTIHKR